MKKVLFIKNSLYGEKGEKRDVTDRAAESYVKAGIAEYVVNITIAPTIKGSDLIIKEEKAHAETKEEKQSQKAERKQVKVTKAPKF